MKFLLILLLAIPCYSQIDTEYDKFKDQTQITSRRFPTKKVGDKRSFAAVTLYMTHPGQKMSGNVTFWLEIDTMGSNWQWTDVEQVIVLADGKRTTLDVADRDSGVHTSRYGRGSVSTTEEIYLEVSPDKLKWILEAQTIELQAGRIEFALDEKSIATFRKMLAMVDN